MRFFILLLLRIANGERFRKAMAEDFRRWFGFFFFAGLLMLGGVCLAQGFLSHVTTFTLWLGATILISAMGFGLIVWARFVPAAISLALGILTWGLVVWLALRETHVL